VAVLGKTGTTNKSLETWTVGSTTRVSTAAAKAGSSLQLQLVATTVAYITPRLGGTINFDRVKVEVPTAKGLHVLQRG
jgi:hypothetical protein